MRDQGTRQDQVGFRCSVPCESAPRLEMRVPRGTLPTPGPCPGCKEPMALVGRIPLQSGEERRSIAEHEVSG